MSLSGRAAASPVACRLAAAAVDAFPELGPQPQVLPTHHQRRRHCTLDRFDLVGASGRRSVLVKARHLDGPPVPGAVRPLLGAALPLSPQRAAQREYDVLSRIHRGLAEHPDPRFGAVRPLGVEPAHAAVAMEFLELPTLRTLLLRERRLPGGLPPEVWQSTGAWLSRFHRTQPGADLPQRLTTREEVQEMLLRYAGYLAAVTRQRERLRCLATRAAGVAARLPEVLTPRPVHHDFVARNVLVGHQGVVTVIDPMTTSCAPGHEDVGRFLAWLHANVGQVATHGRLFPRDRLDQWEQLFLTGYFGGDVPHHEVAVFQVLVLLDRSAALVARASGRRPAWAARQVVAWMLPHLLDEVDRVLSSVDRG